jgi:hypothetical protein
VPLFYENRTPELQLVNADLNDEIYELIENASLDPDQEALAGVNYPGRSTTTILAGGGGS